VTAGSASTLLTSITMRAGLFGVDTRQRDATAFGGLARGAHTCFDDGAFRPPMIDRVIPLSARNVRPTSRWPVENKRPACSGAVTAKITRSIMGGRKAPSSKQGVSASSKAADAVASRWRVSTRTAGSHGDRVNKVEADPAVTADVISTCLPRGPNAFSPGSNMGPPTVSKITCAPRPSVARAPREIEGSPRDEEIVYRAVLRVNPIGVDLGQPDDQGSAPFSRFLCRSSPTPPLAPITSKVSPGAAEHIQPGRAKRGGRSHLSPPLLEDSVLGLRRRLATGTGNQFRMATIDRIADLAARVPQTSTPIHSTGPWMTVPA